MGMNINQQAQDKRADYYNSGNNNGAKIDLKYKKTVSEYTNDKGKHVTHYVFKPFVETEGNNIPSSLTLSAFMLNDNPNSTLTLNSKVTGASVFEEFNSADISNFNTFSKSTIDPNDDHVSFMEFAGVLNGYKNNALEEANNEKTRNSNVTSVDMNGQDNKTVRNIYDFIAGDDGKIQKNEFVNFYDNLFNGAKDNGNGTKTVKREKIDLMM